MSSLKKLIKKAMFRQSILGVFINPYYILRSATYKKILKNEKHMQGKMLDFGCGCKPYDGVFTKVKQHIGLDTKKSGHNHKDEEIDVYYDGKKIPFGNNHFDSILASEVLEHVPDIDKTLDELHRVLKKDGNILISMPFAWNEHEKPYDFRRYSTEGIISVLQSHGFKIVSIEKTTNAIETIFQLWNEYIIKVIKIKNKYLAIIRNLIFAAPITIIGMIFGKILPKDNDLFLNIVVVAKKQ